ncbi:hypothetical protein LWI28_028519 [Acer negundo]|uniref:Uncharacterized protein n=1 Tax=Acer negundo TaxID=4023 RepID=A0AAD5IXS1_ACENE|nr:hypothetical protein LWI28_028519 [Acer negundo]
MLLTGGWKVLLNVVPDFWNDASALLKSGSASCSLLLCNSHFEVHNLKLVICISSISANELNLGFSRLRLRGCEIVETQEVVTEFVD